MKQHVSTAVGKLNREVLEVGKSIYLDIAGENQLNPVVLQLRVTKMALDDDGSVLEELYGMNNESKTTIIPVPAGCTVERREYYAPPINLKPVPENFSCEKTQ